MCARAAPEVDYIDLVQHSCLLDRSVKLRLGHVIDMNMHKRASKPPPTGRLLPLWWLQGSWEQQARADHRPALGGEQLLTVPVCVCRALSSSGWGRPST